LIKEDIIANDTLVSRIQARFECGEKPANRAIVDLEDKGKIWPCKIKKGSSLFCVDSLEWK
jgi:hypothetical protein